MPLFSRRLGRWVSRAKPSTLVYADPHDPHSPSYAERNRAHVTELPSGLVRVDIGEPVKRLPSEPQPVSRDKAPAPMVVAPEPAPAPEAPPAAAPTLPRKPHRAITRDA